MEGADGTCLTTDVYLPRRGEPVPTVVTPTPYGRSAHVGEGLGWRARGFGYLVQDVRGVRIRWLLAVFSPGLVRAVISAPYPTSSTSRSLAPWSTTG